MTAYTSPDVRNYVVGKANIYFTPLGADPVTGRLHMGNVPEIDIEPTVDVLEHRSSMTGVAVRDYTATTGKSALLSLTIEEVTPQNMAIAFMGVVGTDTNGNTTVSGLTEDLVRGTIDIEATHDIGPRWNVHIPRVAMRPAGPVPFISEEWLQIELEGDVEAVDGSFFTATLQDSAGTTEPAPSTETET